MIINQNPMVQNIYNRRYKTFEEYPYTSERLGVFYTKESTTFRIWAPSAQRVILRIYNDPYEGYSLLDIELENLKNGVWYAEVKENVKNKYYTFQVKHQGDWLKEVPDIYCRATGVNGIRGYIFDSNDTDPILWQNDTPISINSISEAVLYETHIRDFTINFNSGIHHKGKFIGFIEKGTQTSKGKSTGIDHLKELGITHVHLLPVSDFYTVNELNPIESYNWGYDPLHYNTLEGWYSIEPQNPIERIREFKELVMALHSYKIGVVIDVVYNHTGRTERSVMNQTVPKYFYRLDSEGNFSNGSGCGNEIATERAMVRKFIIDSIKYWVEEYHIDGIRFDLMGLIDIDTVQEIKDEVRKINPSIILYGEGWSADASPLPKEKQTLKTNIKNTEGIAVFSDEFRDALLGDIFNPQSKGFISDKTLNEEELKFSIAAAIDHPQIVLNYVESITENWAKSPLQVVNYLTCHDNYTLFDKLSQSLKENSASNIKQRIKLGLSILMTSQGTPFLHSGIEMLRSKSGIRNSYNAPDPINWIDWSQKDQHYDLTVYLKKLISLRKAHPAFRMTSEQEIKEKLVFSSEYIPGTVSYSLKNNANNDSWEEIFVVHNAKDEEITLKLPQEGQWICVGNKWDINEEGLEIIYGSSIKVSALSTMILKK